MMSEKVNSNVKRLRKSVEKFYDDLKVGINVNDAQPGSGKTYGFVQHIKKHPNKALIFFSSNHDHLNRLERNLKNINIPFTFQFFSTSGKGNSLTSVTFKFKITGSSVIYF